jgi:hypothetical protein
MTACAVRPPIEWCGHGERHSVNPFPLPQDKKRLYSDGRGAVYRGAIHARKPKTLTIKGAAKNKERTRYFLDKRESRN